MSDTPPRVRFCVNNPRGLAERKALIARGYTCVGCLGNCTRCFETRFLEIDGQFVEGTTYDEIERSIPTRKDEDCTGKDSTPR